MHVQCAVRAMGLFFAHIEWRGALLTHGNGITYLLQCNNTIFTELDP